MRIREIAQARVRYGYRKIRVLLNREAWEVGNYVMYRLYKEEGLALKRMEPHGKRKAVRYREERFKATGPDPRAEVPGAESLRPVPLHTHLLLIAQPGRTLVRQKWSGRSSPAASRIQGRRSMRRPCILYSPPVYGYVTTGLTTSGLVLLTVAPIPLMT
jgi:hypothetical protein